MSLSRSDLVYLVTETGPEGPAVLATDAGELAVFYVESADSQSAVIRRTGDETALTVPVADLIPINPLT